MPIDDRKRILRRGRVARSVFEHRRDALVTVLIERLVLFVWRFPDTKSTPIEISTG